MIDHLELDTLERISVQHLLKHLHQPTSENALFIAYLFKAMKLGHLCITIDHNAILPHPNQIWPQVDPKAILKGVCEIPDRLINEGASYYFARFWNEKNAFLYALKLHTETPPSIPLTPQIDDETLLPEQRQAINLLENNSLILLTGGPGTGKSFTAARMIQALPQDISLSCAIAAPTGKAAHHLQQTIEKITQKPIESYTLHRLLSGGNLYHDLLLIDEASMIDSRLMTKLFQALKPGSRLILIGDRNQLPPIESGAFFADLIDLFSSSGSVVRLTKCLRAERQELISFSHSLCEGDFASTLAAFQEPHLQRLSDPSPERQDFRTFQRLSTQIFDHFMSLHGDDFQSYRVLSPLRQGLFGTSHLNASIAKRCQEASQETWTAPIIIEKNDSKTGLFNGEVGLLIRKPPFHTPLKKGDVAFFPHSNLTLPALLLPRFSYAYCLSIHKSQGSEFDHVLILLPEGSERFGNEVLYTAATRARQSLTLWSTDDTLRATLAYRTHRHSGLTL